MVVETGGVFCSDYDTTTNNVSGVFGVSECYLKKKKIKVNK